MAHNTLIDNTLIIIRNKYTGSEHAYPKSRYSEIPTFSIENGEPGKTNFHRGDLVSMVEVGSAKIVGYATLALNVTYNDEVDR